jgi:hypothetical protein
MDEKLVAEKVTCSEFWVGPTQVRLTEGNLLNVKAVGPQTYDTAVAQLNIFEQICHEVNGPLNFIIDLNDAGKNSPEARKVWKDVSENEYTGKIALVGIHPVARVIAGFVLSISLSSKMQFFSTREKALKWIYD